MRFIQQVAPSIATLACCTLFSVAVMAQGTGSREAYYKCKDAKGQIHTGSAMPVECQGYDTEVMNARGTVLRTIEGAGTRSSRMEREASEAEDQKRREEQYQRDKVLIETYLSVEEIERLRDQRLN